LVKRDIAGLRKGTFFLP